MGKKKEQKINAAKRAELTEQVVYFNPYERTSLGYNRITLNTLSDMLQRAADGDMSDFALFAEDMEEKDLALQGDLGTRKNAVRGLDFEILPASDDKKDITIAERVREVFDYIPSFDEALLDMLDAVMKGYSVNELIWSYSEGQYWFDKIEFVQPYKITFNNNGQILRRPMFLDTLSTTPSDLPYGKFVYHRHKTRSGLPTRAGLGRSLAYFYLFKNFDVKTWLTFIERFGVPMRLGKYGANASEKDIATLKRALWGLATDTAAVMSKDTEIEFIRLEAANEGAQIFEGFNEWIEKSYSKLILGHASASTETAGKLGGDEQVGKVRQDLLEADAKALQNTITEQIIAPWILYTYGETTAVPKFKFRYEPPEDMLSKADMVGKLVLAGMKTIPVPWLHETFAIPQAAEDEQTLADLEKETPAKSAGLQKLIAALSAEHKQQPEHPGDIITAKALSEDVGIGDMTAELQVLLAECETLEEVRDRLFELYGSFGTEKFGEVMSQTLLLSDLAGRAEGRSRK